MLAKSLADRLGAIVFYHGDGVYAENDEIREHPFMQGGQWERMEQKKVLVSCTIIVIVFFWAFPT